MNFKLYFDGDMKRYGGSCSNYTKNFHRYFRKCQNTDNMILKIYFKFIYRIIRELHGLEIFPQTSVGRGLYIGHPYNITINPNAVIGENCNIHKGVVIGRENRGKRAGTPVIGDRVWIGINAAIVGNIKIGSDVLIAPNSYVNCDVPDHSVVFGNPCIIKSRENATEGYVNNIVI